MNSIIRIRHFSPEHEKIVDTFIDRVKEQRKKDTECINMKNDVEMFGPVSKQEICIPDDQYDLWTAQISKLKPKKQKLWKDTLWDKWGCKTKVRYENGEFWNYCAVGSRGSEQGMKCKVLTQTRMIRRALKDGRKIQTGSLIGAASMVATKMKMEAETIMNKDEHKVMSKIIDDMSRDFAVSVTNGNKTGNHYRNHIVNVSGNLYGH
tara:strand:+ start:115 stop:735 length:621 start_codon:yes stop_codon:yes gene_type:complete